MAAFSNPSVEIASQVAESTANTALPGVGSAIAEIESIFSADHAAAVAKEAKTLNNATPTFLSEVSKVMSAAQSGQLTPAQAIQYLQQAQSIYYTTVSGIIKKGGPCVASCVIGGESNSGQPAGWVSTSPICCNNSGTCNASCCIGCYIVEPTVAQLTAILNAGEGTFTIPSSQQNGQITATPVITITYRASAVNTVLGSTLAPIVPAVVKQHPWIFIGLALFIVAGIVGTAVEE